MHSEVADVAATDRIAVALVDDHELVRQSVAAWLAAEGAGVDVVATACTVEHLRKSPGWGVPVVLLDLVLGDGRTLESNVAELVAAGSRVIVVSARAEPSTVRRALRAGATGYVPKAARAEDMLEAIRTTAAGSTYMTAELAAALLDPGAADRPAFSPQELRTLRMYAGGLAMKSVALRLGITEGAVKSYVDRIREKYDRVGRQAPTKVDLYRRAVEDGLIDPAGGG